MLNILHLLLNPQIPISQMKKLDWERSNNLLKVIKVDLNPDLCNSKLYLLIISLCSFLTSRAAAKSFSYKLPYHLLFHTYLVLLIYGQN